jgi:hypothetical protein
MKLLAAIGIIAVACLLGGLLMWLLAAFLFGGRRDPR